MGSLVNSGFLKKGKMMFRLWRCFLRWYTKTPSQNSHPRSWGPGGPWLQASKIIETCPCCWSATRGQLWFGAFCDKGDMVLPRFWKTRRVAILNCPVDVEELGWCENLRSWWSSGEQNHVQWRICTRMLCVRTLLQIWMQCTHHLGIQGHFRQWSCFQECIRRRPFLHFQGSSLQSTQQTWRPLCTHRVFLPVNANIND